MQKSLRKQSNTVGFPLGAAALGALAGAVVFLLLYGTSVLHPSWDAWILNGYDEWDVQQHYAGWLLFRNAHWGFPLGLADTMALPAGTAISYTDSIPWVSIALKLLRGVLPATFQWFGLYTLGCFVLQGAAGALLCCRNMARKLSTLAFGALGGALFACLPTLWERAFRHTALASHWLYLFALYAYLVYRTALREKRRALPWAFPVLAFLAVGIHPYFLPPVMICALLAAVEDGRVAGRWGRGALQFGVSLLSALGGGLLCGAIGGTGLSRDGYGSVSMNLNAIFNPSSRGGYQWSKILPVLPQQAGQYDGFNYLGLGVLALLAAALVCAAVGVVRRPVQVRQWWGRNWPLFAACAFLALFAVSNGIYFGDRGVTLPLPPAVLALCGIFRSSGRMFYLVGACMVLFGVNMLKSLGQTGKKMSWLPCVLLALVLAVQVWDLSGAAAQKRQMLNAGTLPINATVANNDQTQALGVGHKTLLATSPVREDRLRLLAILAGKQGLATNLDITVAEGGAAQPDSMTQAAALLQSGKYDPETVYVTTDGGEYENWQAIFAQDAAVTLFVADSCYFLAPAA